MLRAALFTVVGGGSFVYWLVADPGYEESVTQSEWTYVFAFSVAILGRVFGNVPRAAGAPVRSRRP